MKTILCFLVFFWYHLPEASSFLKNSHNGQDSNYQSGYNHRPDNTHRPDYTHLPDYTHRQQLTQLQQLSPLQCLPLYCSYGHCVIENRSGSLMGTCHQHVSQHRDCQEVKYNINDGEDCQCQDNYCVDRMKESNTHLATHYQCLNHSCHGNVWCHIYDQAGVASVCTSKPSNEITCIDHSTVMQAGGCYCKSSECVQQTVLHALGTSCTADKEIEFYEESASYHSRCQTLGQGKLECEIFELYSLLHNDANLPCICNTQSCAHMMESKVHEALMTTAAPTTTTMTQTPFPVLYASCVHEHCNFSKPNCHMFVPDSKPDGSCEQSKIGPECVTGMDLYSSGCHCETTICVIEAIKAFLTLPTTKIPTEKPTTTQIPTAREIHTPTTTELPTTTAIPTTTNVPTTTQIPTTREIHTTTVIPTTTELPTTTEILTTTKLPTSSEIPTTKEIHTGRSCNMCGDKDLSIPCSNREIIMDLQSTCNTGEDYCMTDVYHDAYGQIDVYKRCVNKATCELEWIGQSADLDYCKKYGVIKNPSAFQCHFCCVSDGCNTNKMPNSTSLFTKV